MKTLTIIFTIFLEFSISCFSQELNYLTGKVKNCTGFAKIKFYYISNNSTQIGEDYIDIHKDSFKFEWKYTVQDSDECLYDLIIEGKNANVTLPMKRSEKVSININLTNSWISFQQDVEIVGSETAKEYSLWNEWTLAVGDSIRSTIDSLEKKYVTPSIVNVVKKNMIAKMLNSMEKYATMTNSSYLATDAVKAMIFSMKGEGSMWRDEKRIKNIVVLIDKKFTKNPIVRRAIFESSTYNSFIKGN